MPLKPEELQEAGLVQFPMIIGGVVPVVNIPGVGAGQLTLDGPTLASIYMGEITKWNDPKIVKLNPKLKLPATAIAPVLSLGWLGHQLPVHGLPVEGQPEVQGCDRRQHLGAVAGRHRRQGQ